MRVVVALGGNALVTPGKEIEYAGPAHVGRAAESVAALARSHELVVTHGNGPQVGLLALQSEAYDPGHPTPLDVLGAESEGMIGYLLERELRSRIPDRDVATLLTQVEVRPDDEAFLRPTKPIGPTYTEEAAQRLSRKRGWQVAPNSHGWRRVVPSPRPVTILESDTIRLLMDHGIVVVCAGGGGIPVLVDEWGGIRGAEGVVDKDATAALLGRVVGADALLLLTDVAGVMEGWGTADARLVDRMTVEEALAFPAPEGSMGPKLRACAEFVSSSGGFAAIGALEDGVEVLEGRRGTRIAAD
ncbi:MAG: carbamate kinase [Gemmatimonadales bacterium]|nr:MAG: carbamate kinase [Gemmatimonadales bacterium]